MMESEDRVSVQEQVEVASGGAFEAAPAVVMIHEPTSSAAEAIGALRTQLVTQEIGNGLGAVSICGASSGSGTTFVAVNLAIALSQIGVRTLLIDADMREPGVQAMIMPPGSVEGLQHCLGDAAGLSDVIHDDILPNLSILYAGGASPQSQELLSSTRFRELMTFCTREYDFTVIDTPPANQSADSRQIAAVAGAALVVARKDHTLLDDVRTLVTELERNESRVIGTVLNSF